MMFLSAFVIEKCIRLVRENFLIFRYGQYVNGIAVKCGLKMYFVTRSKLSFTRNLKKCNSNFTKKITHRCNVASWLRRQSVARSTVFLRGLAV